jgi:hypothetical protein
MNGSRAGRRTETRRSAIRTAATAVGFIMNFAFYGLLFVEAIVLERRYGFAPLLTGLALLPQTGIIAVGSWFDGVLTGRIGPRLPMIVGMAVGAAGFFGLTVLGPTTPYVAIVVPDECGRVRHLVLHAGGHVRCGRGGSAGSPRDRLGRAEREPTGRWCTRDRAARFIYRGSPQPRWHAIRCPSGDGPGRHGVRHRCRARRFDAEDIGTDVHISRSPPAEALASVNPTRVRGT